jgi:hypothetical protein
MKACGVTAVSSGDPDSHVQDDNSVGIRLSESQKES